MYILKHIIFLIPFVLASSLSMAAQELYEHKLPGAVSVSMGGPVIDELSLKDTDVTEALGIIAQKSGLNIITGSGVKGRVTVFLKQVNAREAVRIVLEANDLAYVEDGGIIRVMTAAEYLAKFGYTFGQDKDSKLIKLNFIAVREALRLLDEMKSPQGKIVVNEETKTVLIVDSREKVRAMEVFLADLDVPLTTVTLSLKNARAEELAPEVKRMLTQSVGVVSADAQANTLEVTDTVARVEYIRRAVGSMDARGRVMMLEAKLVHVVLNDEHPQGVDWGGFVEDHQRLRLAGKYDFLAGSDSARGLSLGMINNDDFPALIEALDTVGIVQEYPLSTIRVAGEEQVRLVVRLDDPSLDMITFVAGEEDEGLQPVGGASLAFTVKPSFDVTGEVMTSIVSDDPVAGEKNEPGPAYGARASVLSAHEGYTAVLGGLIVVARTAPARKIPLLGDLPILGFAFRMEGAVRKEEFVVFLTPRSISLSQAMADEGSGVDASLSGEETAP